MQNARQKWKSPTTGKIMVKRLAVDSSVIISSLLKNEARHKEAFTIWEDILKGKSVAIMPLSILVEVVAAIRFSY